MIKKQFFKFKVMIKGRVKDVFKGDCIVKVFVCVGVVLCCEVECMIEVGCVVVDGKVLMLFVFNIMGYEKIIVDDVLIVEVELECIWFYYKLLGLVMIYKDE